MSGNRYVLDTNAIVSLLQGNAQLLQKADWIGISIISQIAPLIKPERPFPNLIIRLLYLPLIRWSDRSHLYPQFDRFHRFTHLIACSRGVTAPRSRWVILIGSWKAHLAIYSPLMDADLPFR